MGMSSVFMPLMRVHEVDRERPLDLLDRPLHVGPGLDAVDEGQIGPGLQIQVAAPDGLVQPQRGEHVGAGVDDEVRVEPVADRRAGPHLAGHLVGVDALLARHVTAALGKDLVLDVHAGHAHAR